MKKLPPAPLPKLHMAAYTDSALANVCWSPAKPDRIADVVGPHVHSFYEIVLIEAGAGSQLVNGVRFEANAGDLMLLGPGSRHDPRLLQSAAIWVFIFNFQALDIDGWEGSIHTTKAETLNAAHSLLRDVQRDEQRHLQWRLSASDLGLFTSWFRRIEQETLGRRRGWEKVVRLTLELVLIELGRRRTTGPFTEGRPRHPVVALAMDFIDANFRHPIGLRDIAKNVGRSPAYLTNLVTKYTGRPVMVWLSERRLVEARNLILTSSKSIREVAESVGYENLSHFSQMFSRKYGDSPSHWRGKVLR